MEITDGRARPDQTSQRLILSHNFALLPFLWGQHLGPRRKGEPERKCNHEDVEAGHRSRNDRCSVVPDRAEFVLGTSLSATV